MLKHQNHKNFYFNSHSFDPQSGLLKLRYSIDDTWHFTEEINFNTKNIVLDTDKQDILENIFQTLHILAGTSYYKTVLPEHLNTPNHVLSTDQAYFFKKIYENGLGEFAYRNNIAINDTIHFPSTPASQESKSTALKRRSIVLIGGGKDSLVSVEALKSIKENITLLAVNPKKPIIDCIEKSGLPNIIISRKLDPLLMQLNEQGAYNGHVPITSIISTIALAAAIIYDYDTIILSNERSASEATLQHEGIDINHQYSKSINFENDLRQYIADYMTPSLTYLSLLRPFSEIKIARALSKTETYDQVFTSCNKAFKLNDPMTDKRWCGHCPKCQFVFLALATAFDNDRLIKIFGKNLLNDSAQLEDYKNLSGLTGHKPWECVGEILECASALHNLSTNPAWKNDTIVQSLAPLLLQKYGAQNLEIEFNTLLQDSDEHNIPLHLQGAMEWLN